MEELPAAVPEIAFEQPVGLQRIFAYETDRSFQQHRYRFLAFA